MARAAKSGLTLLETLVMIAITALIGAVLMNVAARANASNFSRADRVVAASAISIADAEMRRAAAHVAPDGPGFAFTGDARRVAFQTIGYSPCRLSRNETVFAIEANSGGGALVRQCAGGARVALLEWPRGVRASFSYSADGVAWLPTTQMEEGADPFTFARLELDGPRAPAMALVIRVGGARDDGRGDGPTPPPGQP